VHAIKVFGGVEM